MKTPVKPRTNYLNLPRRGIVPLDEIFDAPLLVQDFCAVRCDLPLVLCDLVRDLVAAGLEQVAPIVPETALGLDDQLADFFWNRHCGCVYGVLDSAMGVADSCPGSLYPLARL